MIITLYHDFPCGDITTQTFSFLSPPSFLTSPLSYT